jgi:hypothetical protein
MRACSWPKCSRNTCFRSDPANRPHWYGAPPITLGSNSTSCAERKWHLTALTWMMCWQLTVPMQLRNWQHAAKLMATNTTQTKRLLGTRNGKLLHLMATLILFHFQETTCYFRKSLSNCKISNSDHSKTNRYSLLHKFIHKTFTANYHIVISYYYYRKWGAAVAQSV